MEKITRQSKAASTAARWKNNYFGYAKWFVSDLTGLDSEKIHRALRALGDNPTPEAVNAVIGNTAWTDIHCEECQCRTPECVIEFCAVEDDIEYPGVRLCVNCLRQAVLLAEDASWPRPVAPPTS